MKAVREADELVAPRSLALVPAFLNTVEADPSPEDLTLAEQVRSAAAAGEPLNSIAARFAISRQLASAIVRRRRFTPIPPSSSDAQYAASIGSRETAADWLTRQ